MRTRDYPFTSPVTAADGGDPVEAARHVYRRAAGTLFAAGATSDVLPIFTGSGERTSPTLLLVAAIITLASAALLQVWRRPPDVVLVLLPAYGTLLITLGVAIANPLGAAPLFYLWPLLVAAYFLRGRELLAHAVFVEANLALVLAFAVETPAKGQIFLDVSLSLGLVTALVDGLTARMERLVARLRHAATTDALTGVLNRRAFEDALAAEMARGRPFALLVVDLDHFKGVNDRLGHAGGDGALQDVVEVMLADKRAEDLLARIGGEEFALLLTGARAHGAEAFAERLRERVEVGTGAGRVPMTVSIGVAVHPHDGATAAELLLAADRALYAAKDAGRNRTVAAAALAA